MDQPQFVEKQEPEAVFTLLSDDNRVGILRALWDGDEPMSFSELHDAVGIGDSGQFNYHLGKLTGQFVRKNKNGYSLTAAGEEINGAIEAGSYTASGRMEPIQLDSPCPTCGGSRRFYYEDETARVDCDSCAVQAQFSIPPSAFVGCDREEIPDVAGRYLRTIIDSLDRGFCSQCDGPVERDVRRLVDAEMWEPSEADTDEGWIGDPKDVPLIQYECLQCGARPTSGLHCSLLTHPEVVGFYHDRGVDLQAHSLWEFSILGTERGRVHSTDPLRASATFTADGDRLTVVVNEQLRVVETTVGNAV